MTDLAHMRLKAHDQKSTESSKIDPVKIDPGFLLLPFSEQPLYRVEVILVSAASTNDLLAPAFALPGTGIYYRGGVKWEFPTHYAGYAITIEFDLIPEEIDEIEPSPGPIYLSNVFSPLPGAKAQLCTIPCWAGSSMEYHFSITYNLPDTAIDMTVDPIVIVTPISPKLTP